MGRYYEAKLYSSSRVYSHQFTILGLEMTATHASLAQLVEQLPFKQEIFGIVPQMRHLFRIKCRMGVGILASPECFVLNNMRAISCNIKCSRVVVTTL